MELTQQDTTEMSAFAACWMGFNFLSQILKETINLDYQESYIVDEKGYLIAGTKGEVYMPDVTPSKDTRVKTSNTPYSSLLRRTDKWVKEKDYEWGKVPKVSGTVRHSGEEWFLDFLPIELYNLEWTLVRMTRRSAVLGKIDESTRNVIIIAVICICASLAFSAVLGFILTIPMKNLAKSMEKVAVFVVSNIRP